MLDHPPTPVLSSHLDIRVVRPVKAALPIINAVYRSHFIPPDAVDTAGDLVAFVLVLLDEPAQGTARLEQRATRRQLDLV